MDHGIFQRREIKFLVDSRQRAILEQAFRGRMVPDPHGESTICNVYFDTPDYRLVRASMEKPVYKEKLRMRSYGRVSPEGSVFLELKKKYKGVVYKRRIALSEREACPATARSAGRSITSGTFTRTSAPPSTSATTAAPGTRPTTPISGRPSTSASASGRRI